MQGERERGRERLSKVRKRAKVRQSLLASCALPAPISLVSTTTKQFIAHEIIFVPGCLPFLCRRPRRRGRLPPHGTRIHHSRATGIAKGIAIQACSPASSFPHVVCHVVLGAEEGRIPIRERPLFMSLGFSEIENALSLASNCCQRAGIAHSEILRPCATCLQVAHAMQGYVNPGSAESSLPSITRIPSPSARPALHSIPTPNVPHPSSMRLIYQRLPANSPFQFGSHLSGH